MSGKKMFFGTRGAMRMIPCPRIDMDASKVGWRSSTLYLTGGAGMRDSIGSHAEYGMSWGGTRTGVRPIFDYADGLYDSHAGINLIYFLDPTAMDVNVLPQMWASPFQQAADGLTLFDSQRPQMVDTPSNALDYPMRSVTYLCNGESRSLWVPIPPGYVAWVGVHGVAEGLAGLTVATTFGLNTATPTLLPTLSINSTTRFSNSYAASGAVDGILLSLANNGPTSDDLFTWTGTMVQILKAGVTPDAGGFISGQGHSGCQFDGKPSKMVHQAHGGPYGDGRIDVAAKLVETGSWL